MLTNQLGIAFNHTNRSPHAIRDGLSGCDFASTLSAVAALEAVIALAFFGFAGVAAFGFAGVAALGFAVSADLPSTEFLAALATRGYDLSAGLARDLTGSAEDPLATS